MPRPKKKSIWWDSRNSLSVGKLWKVDQNLTIWKARGKGFLLAKINFNGGKVLTNPFGTLNFGIPTMTQFPFSNYFARMQLRLNVCFEFTTALSTLVYRCVVYGFNQMALPAKSHQGYIRIPASLWKIILLYKISSFLKCCYYKYDQLFFT